MAARQQKNQLKLAFPAGGRGEAPKSAGERAEAAGVGYGTESPASPECLIWHLGDSLTIRTAGYGPVRPVV